MEKHTAYFNLLEQVKRPGCPVCAQTAASLKNYLDTYLYESVTEAETWDRLTAAGGYCPRHGRMLEGFSDGLAVSLFYRHLLRLNLKSLKPGPRPGPGLMDRLLRRDPAAASGPCPACGYESEIEAQQVRLLAQALEEPELWGAWSGRQARPGESLCLGHLRETLAQAGPRGAQLLEGERRRLEALAAELDEFVRKSDHACDEKMGAEGDAWKRVLSLFRGIKA